MSNENAIEHTRKELWLDAFETAWKKDHILGVEIAIGEANKALEAFDKQFNKFKI